MPATLPTVTAVVPVRDGAAFLAEALESALGQDYPAALLDVVVADDGSTDASAAIADAAAARHPGRVQVLRRPAAGPLAALNAARAAARGELIALLDADDRWPEGKLRRQAELLADAPEVALVYSDMTVIDPADAVLHDSWLDLVWDGAPPAGRCFGALLAANPATASSIVLRAEVSRRIGDLPPRLRCGDWWLALGAARHGEVAYLPAPRTGYRVHEANLSLGTEGPALGRAHAYRAAVQRTTLRTLDPGEVAPLELALAWNAFEANVAEALRLIGSPFAAVLTVTDGDRAAGAADRRAACDAARRGDHAAAFLGFTRSAAADPWDEAALAGQAAAWSYLA